MKKARKLGLQSLALVLMAFVLVAGVAFGMTGAWFTQQEGRAATDINFGKVTMTVTESVDGKTFGTLNINSREFDTGVAMPGDNISYAIHVAEAEGSNDFWYVVIINAKIYDGEDLKDTVSATTSETAVDSSVAGTTGVDYGGVLTLTGANYGNDYEECVVKMSYEVRAIQKANVTAAEAYRALVTNYATVEADFEDGTFEIPAGA